MSTLTSILGTDLISNGPSVLNANFNSLNSDKAEATGGTLTSPSLLGTPVASTVSAGDNSETVATTKYVDTALAGNLPTFITTSPYAGALTATNISLVSSVLSQIGLFQIPIGMTVNQISLYTTTVTTPGTVRMGIYNTDGSTQVTSVLFASIAGTGMKTQNVSSVALNAGTYYYAFSGLEGNIEFRSVAPTADLPITGSVINKLRYISSIATTNGDLPASFTPTTMPIITPNFINIRFDN